VTPQAPGDLLHLRKPTDLPPLNEITLEARIHVCDAAPNLIPAGLLAMQGRYLGMPR